MDETKPISQQEMSFCNQPTGAIPSAESSVLLPVKKEEQDEEEEEDNTELGEEEMMEWALKTLERTSYLSDSDGEGDGGGNDDKREESQNSSYETSAASRLQTSERRTETRDQEHPLGEITACPSTTFPNACVKVEPTDSQLNLNSAAQIESPREPLVLPRLPSDSNKSVKVEGVAGTTTMTVPCLLPVPLSALKSEGPLHKTLSSCEQKQTYPTASSPVVLVPEASTSGNGSSNAGHDQQDTSSSLVLPSTIKIEPCNVRLCYTPATFNEPTEDPLAVPMKSENYILPLKEERIITPAPSHVVLQSDVERINEDSNVQSMHDESIANITELHESVYEGARLTTRNLSATVSIDGDVNPVASVSSAIATGASTTETLTHSEVKLITMPYTAVPNSFIVLGISENNTSAGEKSSVKIPHDISSIEQNRSSFNNMPKNSSCLNSIQADGIHLEAMTDEYSNKVTKVIMQVDKSAEVAGVPHSKNSSSSPKKTSSTALASRSTIERKSGEFSGTIIHLNSDSDCAMDVDTSFEMSTQSASKDLSTDVQEGSNSLLLGSGMAGRGTSRSPVTVGSKLLDDTKAVSKHIFNCIICDKKVKNKGALVSHTRTHFRNGTVNTSNEMDVLPGEEDTSTNVQSGTSHVHSSGTASSKDPGGSSIASESLTVWDSNGKESSGQMVDCNICDKKFPHKIALISHLTTHFRPKNTNSSDDSDSSGADNVADSNPIPEANNERTGGRYSLRQRPQRVSRPSRSDKDSDEFSCSDNSASESSPSDFSASESSFRASASVGNTSSDSDSRDSCNKSENSKISKHRSSKQKVRDQNSKGDLSIPSTQDEGSSDVQEHFIEGALHIECYLCGLEPETMKDLHNHLKSCSLSFPEAGDAPCGDTDMVGCNAPRSISDNMNSAVSSDINVAKATLLDLSFSGASASRPMRIACMNDALGSSHGDVALSTTSHMTRTGDFDLGVPVSVPISAMPMIPQSGSENSVSVPITGALSHSVISVSEQACSSNSVHINDLHPKIPATTSTDTVFTSNCRTFAIPTTTSTSSTTVVLGRGTTVTASNHNSVSSQSRPKSVSPEPEISVISIFKPSTQKMSNSKSVYPCQDLAKVFTTAVNAARPKISKTAERQFKASVKDGPSIPRKKEISKCVKCKEQLKSVNDCIEHSKKHFKVKKAVGSADGDSSFGSRSVPVEESNKNLCPLCDKPLGVGQILVDHVLSHWPLTCGQCRMRFNNKKGFKHHKTACRGLPHPSLCVLCLYVVKELHLLPEHILRHMKYICPVCSRAFFSENKFRSHLDKHVNNEIKCNQCDKVYTNRENMLAHIQRMHRISSLPKNRDDVIVI